MADHVFVETNWVVDYAAPSQARNPQAEELLDLARAGKLTLHVPMMALVEARKVLREKRPRAELDAIRAFVKASRHAGEIVGPEAEAAFKVLTRFEQHVKQERTDAPRRVEALANNPAVEVFPMDAAMLAESTELAANPGIDLQSFDLAILASILVVARALHADGDDVSFCTLDSDLQPWDKAAHPKPTLRALYERAGVWVFGDFARTTPVRPAG